MKRTLLAIAALVVAIAVAPIAGAAGDPSDRAVEKAQTTKIQILGLNDFHGNLLPPTGSGGRIGALTGGLDRLWEFNVRELVEDELPVASGGRESSGGAAVDGEPSGEITDVWPEAQVQQAAALIRGTYGKSEEPGVDARELTKALEAARDAPRHQWPTGLCRRMWEFLSEAADQRRRSPAHRSRGRRFRGGCRSPA